MNKPIKKIGIILILVVLLPAVFFAVYEINSLNENEKVIERIYTNQIDAILYSVNQYSEDVVGSWRSTINDIIRGNKETDNGLNEKISGFFADHPSIALLFFADSLGNPPATFYRFGSPAEKNLSREVIEELIKENKNRLQKLFRYEKSDYYKIEPVTSRVLDNSSAVLFILQEGLNEKNICGLVIDQSVFINSTLSPRIQSAAQNEFSIYAFNDSVHYDFNNEEEFNVDKIEQSRQLWLLPDYKLGISLKGETIDELVKERAKINLILIITLVAVLIGGVFIVFRNIKKEVELAQIKSDFVSNVSHELRTPLSLITMFAETLELGRVKTEEKKNEYYSIISKESTRLSRIVNKILNFSQIEAGKRKYNFDKIDLNSVADTIYETYRFHIEKHGFKFEVEKANYMPGIYADKEAVEEAVINLIDNSLKYSKDKKEIKLVTGRSEGKVFIEVSDKGLGISTEDQKKIFEKFFRVSAGDIHNTKGTGLGLTIMKHIMDAHKGDITLKSKPGSGSTFRLSFNTEEKL